MSKNTLIVAAVLVLLVLGYVLLRPATDTTPSPAQVPITQEELTSDNVMTVALTQDPTNIDFAQGGRAILEEIDTGLMVTLEVSGYQSDIPQPAHIHTGVCPDVGGIVYSLENVVDGMSVTTLDGVTLADLERQVPLAINVHKSETETNIYTSCGNLDF
jgi:hypothetical protein